MVARERRLYHHGAVTDVVPSEELRALLLRIYTAWENADTEAFEEMFSAAPHLLLVGTDPDEWWSGRDGVKLFCAQIRETTGLSIEPGPLVAYAAGSVGWIADQPLLKFDGGLEVRARMTAVLAIERGHWRVVQWHSSIAQANEEAIGYALPTNVEQIEQLVRDDRPDMKPASAPDGTVTIVFSDIESSTVLLERLGDTEFMRMLAWHDGIVRDTAEEHRGFVVKSQGDGFMLAFPSAAFALRASLLIRDRIAVGFHGLPIRVRAGLHAGEAIRHDDDFYGRTVVIAARISAQALGGEILASDLVYALARGLGTFTFGEPRTATLKGLDGHFELHPVLS
jgi:class 3 adenylate cyclase